MTEITKIALTGGPCAGKTAALHYLANAFKEQGVQVITVPEQATRLMESGKTPASMGSLAFHSLLFQNQLDEEEKAEAAALCSCAKKVLIVCDRGLLDSRAYVTAEEFASYAAPHGLNEAKIRNRYDAVFHLVTAAKDAEAYYSLDTNAARSEDLEQARELDENILALWVGTQHLRVIDSCACFEEKLQRLHSEVMAVLCLADGIMDLKTRLSRIVVGYTYDNRPVTAGDLKAAGAMAALLKDALKPNLVQTLEHTPALVHGGPFANIAHGCNSVTATKLALKLGDYCVTEAGFGADLGAEKFFDIKCRMAGLKPDAVVVVATIRALKHHGGAGKDQLTKENLTALEKGLPNLLQHVSNVKNTFGLPAVVAINRFPQDTEAEIALLEEKCHELGVNVVLSEVWAKGGEGGMELAREVVRLCEQPNNFHFAYETDESIFDKLTHIVQRVYHGNGVELTPGAQKQMKRLEELGFGKLPVCMAKTQYSFSDDPKKLGAPKDFTVQVRNLKVSAGAGFIVALTGEIMTMPGLPRVPAAERIDVDETGKISGLF